MTRFITFSLIATLLGAVFTAWFSPRVISWWFTPPADIEITCKNAVTWSLETYRECLLGGALMGFIAGVIVFSAIAKKKPKNTNNKTA